MSTNLPNDPNYHEVLNLLSAQDMERACLSCILVKPDLLVEAEVELSEHDFMVPHHKVLFWLFSNLYQQQAPKQKVVSFDTLTLLNQIKTLNVQDEYLNSKKGMDYLESLRAAAMIASADNFYHYVKMVKEFSGKRKIYVESLRVQKELLQERKKPIDDILVQLESNILNIHIKDANMSSKTIQIGEGLKEKISKILSAPKELVGVPTGFVTLDRKMLGLRPGTLTIVAGFYKAGKSMFLENVALNVAKLHIPVFMMSTEMSDWEIQVRAMAHLAELPTEKIETGRMTPEERHRLDRATDLLEIMPFHHVQVLDWNPQKIIALMRRFVYQHVGFNEEGEANPCLIIFDYLKMADTSDGKGWIEHEHQALGQLAIRLKDGASELKVPLLSAAQFNESGHVAASARLKWYGSALLELRNVEQELKDVQKANMDPLNYLNVYKLIVRIQRHGGEETTGIPLRVDKALMTFKEDHTILLGGK